MSRHQEPDVASEYEKDRIAWNLPLPRRPRPAADVVVTEEAAEARSEASDSKPPESPA